MSVEPMLVLSTGHLPEQVMRDLEKEADTGSFITRNIAHEYGVIVYADEPRDATASELAAVIAYAQTQGCSWINFDRDADTIDSLPTWNW